MATFAANAPTSCPSEEHILRLVTGQLGLQDLEHVLAHAEECADCGLVIACAGRVHSKAAGDVDGPPLPLLMGAAFRAGELVGGRYRIEGSVGRGGMGEVYVALDGELGERVALKTIKTDLARKPDAVERFKREIRLARRITHPNVCRVLELGRHEHPEGACQYFFTMEYVRGQSLRRRLLREGTLSEREVALLGHRLAAGLQAIHDQGVVHRDIKTENVHLRPKPDGDFQPMLLDFGVARAFDDRALESTRRGVLVGTPDYMAPEQLCGGQASRETDVYALGLILFECLTGRLPFPPARGLEQAQERLHTPPPAPSSLKPGISPAMDELVLRCLAASPAQRPESAAWLAQRMAELLEGASARRNPTAPVSPAGKARPRWKPIAAVCSALLAATAAAAPLFKSTRSAAGHAAEGFEELEAKFGDPPGSTDPFLAPSLRTPRPAAALAVPEHDQAPIPLPSPAAQPVVNLIATGATRASRPAATRRPSDVEAAEQQRPGPCSPPYHYTDDGIRVYRTECLTEAARNHP